ncbi:MAG: hypothetical protein ACRD1R_11840 [Acidobacteriota bacterium]
MASVLQSKSGQPLARYFPEVVEALEIIPGAAAHLASPAAVAAVA